MTYYVGIEKHPGDPYQIGVYKTRDQLMRGQARDYYQAKNAHELLALLSGIYKMPFWKKAGEELTRVLEELGEEEYYRRLGIGVCPGEEK